MKKISNVGKKDARVLLITNDFPPQFSGGVSNVYFNLCTNDKGHKIKIIAPDCEDAQNFDRINSLEVLRVKTPLGRSLAVGTLAKRKSYDKVIEALATLRGIIPNFRYIIDGGGLEMPHLKELAYVKYSLTDIVSFLGHIDNEKLLALYNTGDLFIMPSRRSPDRRGIEGFGIVYLEVNACELPVISERSGGVEDAAADGKTRILVNPENVEEIAGAILRLYENSEERGNMSKYGRKRAESCFRWGDIISRSLEMIEMDVLEARSSAKGI